MATIMRRQNKKGDVTFRIQVYVKNLATGKASTKVGAWKKPKYMNERDAKKEATKFALEFEERVHRENEMRPVLCADVKLIDFIPVWLEDIKKNGSLSYYTSMVKVSGYIGEKIGNYKLREINPTRVQMFIDDLEGCSLKKRHATAKPLLAVKFDGMGITREQFGARFEVSHRTLGAALLGRVIELASAEKIAKVFELGVKDLFEYKKENTSLSQSSKARYCRTLRAILSLAKRKQLITENYAKGEYVKLVPEPRSKVECMDDDEIKQFINGLQKEEDIRIKTALTTLVMMGVRRGELCGLEWSDIDFEKETINIVRSSIPIAGYGVITGGTKTESSTRKISMPHVLTNLLKEYKSFWDMYTETSEGSENKCKRLFLQADGTAIHPGTIGKWLEKSLLKYGINKHYSVHSLRHSNITMQIISGVPLKTVAGRAGHSSTKVTSEVYSHFMRSSDVEAASKLNAMFE